MAKENNKNLKLADYGTDQVIKDAGSLSYYTPLGNPDEVDHYVGKGNSWEGTSFRGKTERVPGICRLDYMLVPGISTDGASSLNMASKKLYTFVRHANSGSRNYDSPDLMNYAFSYISLAIFMEQCKRAYRCYMRYSGKNRYLGKALIEALGFDYNDLEVNIANYRAMLNIALLRFNALKVPESWPLWGKNYVLNSVILKDGDIDRSQLYLFRSTVIWQYNETGTYVGSLTPYYIFGNNQDNLLDTLDVKTIFDTILNAFVASEDINIMSGDIVKAYGEEKCFELDLLAEDSMIDPIYNREMLEIMHNATIYEVSKTYNATKGNIIVQDTTNNCLKYDPLIVNDSVFKNGEDNKGEGGFVYGSEVEYLDLFRDDVAPIDSVSASIMTVIPKVVFEDGYPIESKFTAIGTELPIDGRLFYIEEGSGTLTKQPGVLRRRLMTVTSSVQDAVMVDQFVAKTLTALSKFDWHPRVCYVVINGAINTSGTPDPGAGSVHANYDLYNYTVVSVSDLTKLHDLHVLGGFGLAE